MDIKNEFVANNENIPLATRKIDNRYQYND